MGAVARERGFRGDYLTELCDPETGIEYDLDSERKSYPSKPHLIKDGGGVKRIVARSLREARRIARPRGLSGRRKPNVLR